MSIENFFKFDYIAMDSNNNPRGVSLVVYHENVCFYLLGPGRNDIVPLSTNLADREFIQREMYALITDAEEIIFLDKCEKGSDLDDPDKTETVLVYPTSITKEDGRYFCQISYPADNYKFEIKNIDEVLDAVSFLP